MIIAACRLCAEDKRFGRDVEVRIVLDVEILADNFQHIQQLTLVLVQSLYLHVEARLGIEDETRGVLDIIREVAFVLRLNLGELFQHRFVGGILFEFNELGSVADILVADKVGNKPRKPRIGLIEPAAMCDAVGDIGKALGQYFVEVAEYALLDYLAVQRAHAVYAVRADDGEVSHAHLTVADYAHSGEDVLAALAVLAAEPRVYLADNRVHARQAHFHQILVPLLQSFAHHRVIGVRHGVDGDVPRALPREAVIVEQQSH